MTIKQIQHLLAYLGYYGSPVDGIWGPVSAEAAREFQQDADIGVDGIPGRQTQEALRRAVGEGTVKVQEDDFWDGIRYFARSEFACRCGCGLDTVDHRLVEICEKVREKLGVFNITSGLRCPAHNARQPGAAANSRHLYGRAVDFSIRGRAAGEVLDYVKTIPGIAYCYAIDAHHVHMDMA